MALCICALMMASTINTNDIKRLHNARGDNHSPHRLDKHMEDMKQCKEESCQGIT